MHPFKKVWKGITITSDSKAVISVYDVPYGYCGCGCCCGCCACCSTIPIICGG
ncbi:MAG: hypothetical protein HXS46_00060 [Theionarchaea archaeon]|nr:hypothetical protein [Theionarchaea archaeon]